MIADKFQKFKRQRHLLKSGWAGVVKNQGPIQISSMLVDRRIVLSSTAVLENKFLGIPRPFPVKKLYQGKVYTIKTVTSGPGSNILIADKKGSAFWVDIKNLKNYNYKPKKYGNNGTDQRS